MGRSFSSSFFLLLLEVSLGVVLFADEESSATPNTDEPIAYRISFGSEPSASLYSRSDDANASRIVGS